MYIREPCFFPAPLGSQKITSSGQTSQPDSPGHSTGWASVVSVSGNRGGHGSCLGGLSGTVLPLHPTPPPGPSTRCSSLESLLAHSLSSFQALHKPTLLQKNPNSLTTLQTVPLCLAFEATLSSIFSFKDMSHFSIHYMFIIDHIYFYHP